KAEEKPQPEPQQTAAAPPPPPPETFVPDAATPPPKKEPDKKADSKQDSKQNQKLDQKDFLKQLNALTSAIDDKPAKTQRNAAADKATNLRTVGDAAPRVGAGDMTRMTATVADFIRAQLLANGCWGDHDDMADARRLRAVIRVRFLASGHFLGEPEL